MFVRHVRSMPRFGPLRLSGAFSCVKDGEIVFAYKVFKYVTAGVSLIYILSKYR